MSVRVEVEVPVVTTGRTGGARNLQIIETEIIRHVEIQEVGERHAPMALTCRCGEYRFHDGNFFGGSGNGTARETIAGSIGSVPSDRWYDAWPLRPILPTCCRTVCAYRTSSELSADDRCRRRGLAAIQSADHDAPLGNFTCRVPLSRLR